MSNNSNLQANLPRFSPTANLPASVAFVESTVANAIGSLPPSSGAQTPWASAINAAGFGISNLSTINGIDTAVNLFTKTSQLVINTVTNGNWGTIIDVTGQVLVAGFLHIKGTDGTANNQCDIIVHMDATPFDDLEAISICQFQGAVMGAAPVLYAQCVAGTGQFVLSIKAPVANYVYTIEAYGDKLPTLALTYNGTLPAPLTEETENLMFTTVNGQIAANSLQAKSFVMFDGGGTTAQFVFYTNGTSLAGGLTVGAGTPTKGDFGKKPGGDR